MNRVLNHDEHDQVEQRLFKNFKEGDKLVLHESHRSMVYNVTGVGTTYFNIRGVARERVVIWIERGPCGRTWPSSIIKHPRYRADALKRRVDAATQIG